VKTVLLIEI